MREMRVVLIASRQGQPDSVIEEHTVQFDESNAVEAALEIAKWLHAAADGLAEEARNG
jgi:hypothetical protein